MAIWKQRPARRARISPAVLLLGCLLAGCGVGETSTASGEPDETRSCSASPAQDPLTTVVVVGDSITAGTGPTDSADEPGERSWVPAADGDPLDFTGGWAVPGTTSVEMRAGVTAMSADVLVLMAGTNDLQHGVAWTQTQDDLVTIVDVVGATRNVLLAIPPLDSRPGETVEFNSRAADLAQEQGWGFIDPWAQFAVDGAFSPGASDDGVHPTVTTADAVGERIRTALVADWLDPQPGC